MDSKSRANEKERNFRNTHLKPELYNNVDPNRSTKWLRNREKKQEMQTDLRFAATSDSQRLKDAAYAN